MTIIGNDTGTYASNSSTVNAALTPDMLDAGSVGIYTLDPTTNLWKLIVKSGSPPAGTVSSTAVKSGYIRIFQGLGNGDFYGSEYHDVAGIQSVNGAGYRAGSGQTIYFGYNSSTGTGDTGFVTSSTVLSQNNIGQYNDVYQREAWIKLRKRERGNNSYGPDIFFNHVVTLTDTAQTVLTDLVSQINAYQEDNIAGFPFSAVLTGAYLTAPVQSASSTATTGGTIAASATIYAKIVALSATGYSLASNEVSQAVGSGTSTNTVTFNWGAVTGATGYRVYLGTATGAQDHYIAVNSGSTVTLTYTGTGQTGYTAGVPPTATNLGIAVTVADSYAFYEGAVGEALANASISRTDPVVPSGDPLQLNGTKGNWIKNEFESNIYRGDMYTMSTIEKKLPKTVDTTKTYDTYDIRSINKTNDKTGQKAQTDQAVQTLVAFAVPGAHTVGTNQEADFQAIMVDIFAATKTIF